MGGNVHHKSDISPTPRDCTSGQSWGQGGRRKRAEYHLPTASLLGSEPQGTAMILLPPGWSLTSDAGAVTAC